MAAIGFILNIPLTLIGLLSSIPSVPSKVVMHRHPLAIIIYVRSFWWRSWLPSKKGIRGFVVGQVVLLGPLEQTKDLEHELVHVEQQIRQPLIYPLLYLLETLRHGYRDNKYEQEAYSKAGNEYKERG